MAGVCAGVLVTERALSDVTAAPSSALSLAEVLCGPTNDLCISPLCFGLSRLLFDSDFSHTLANWKA